MTQWLCSLPWTGFSNDPDGKVRPCCIYKGYITDESDNPYYVQTTSVKEIFASKYMKDLRQQFRDGIKPTGCETCIKDEANGVHSKRLAYANYKKDYAVEPGLPVEYQMILSNACNLKCRSCTPSHSSSWQAEYKVVFGNTGYNMPHSQSGHQKSVLWEQRKEWMSHLERLEIVGGEPFYIKQWQELWKELVDLDYSKNIDMDMSTNCTIYGGDVLRELIPKFKRVGVGLSIDGIGPVYDYLRHPGKWSEVQENILKYKELSEEFPDNLGFSYSHTIGWINAWQLPEFHSWIKEHTPNFRIWDNIIHWPRHMSIIMLPKSAKEKIEQKWKSFDWGQYAGNIQGIINFMNSEQPSDQEIRDEYKKFAVHDDYRNEKTIDVIAEEIREDVRPFFDGR